MKQLITEIVIRSSAESVWAELVDLEAYSEWNPFVVQASGQVVVGGKLEVRIQPPGKSAMTFKPTVTKVAKNQELRWLGRLLLPGAFDGEHIFEIFPHDESSVRLVQRENFKGLLVPLLWNDLDRNTRAGCIAMNEALKQRVESKS